MKKKTRFVILGLLRDEAMTGFFWQESYGQIYPELSLMMKQGLYSTKLSFIGVLTNSPNDQSIHLLSLSL